MGTTYASGSSRDSRAVRDSDALPSASPDASRLVRRRTARRAALRYLIVWSTVAALALIAQVIAPAAAT